MDNWFMGMLLAFFIVFCAVITTVTTIDSKNDTNRMKSCISAGKTWVQNDHTRDYECR